MRTGPGKEFPIKSEINQKGYPVRIIAEFNNWRKVNTKNNLYIIKSKPNYKKQT